MNLRDTLYIKNSHLFVGGTDTVDLVKKYGTPLYVMDESYIRKMCKAFYSALKPYENYSIAYASKAFCCAGIYKILKEENILADVVSGGELYTALLGGMDAKNLFFHGNNKSKAELEFAVQKTVGYIVVDGFYEIELLKEICERNNKTVNVLIRINPKVEAHTHQYVQTGKSDSKFGFDIDTAVDVVKKIQGIKCLNFVGIHNHIGSQIFEPKAYELDIANLTDLMLKIKTELKIDTKVLNIGGGFGAYYTEEDVKLEPEQYAVYVEAVLKSLNENLTKKKLTKPHLVIEPGRSMVAEAGVTLYTAGNIREIKNVRKYVSIDGGIFENIRYALYGSKYSACLANRADEKDFEKVTICGKCCESGDIIMKDIMLPKVNSGDIIAVFTTGAYNYSMASNYNRNFVPPVVLIDGKNSEYLIRPQSFEDLVRNDNIPSWLK